MRVRNVLESKGNSQVHFLSPDATVQDLLEKLAELNIGAMIVSSDGSKVDGIVSERDIVRHMVHVDNTRETKIHEIMTPADALHTSTPDDSFHSLMMLMTNRRVRHVPVLDETGLVGILSIGDVVKHRMQQLEFERDQLNQYVTGSSQ